MRAKFGSSGVTGRSNMAGIGSDPNYNSGGGGGGGGLGSLVGGLDISNISQGLQSGLAGLNINENASRVTRTTLTLTFSLSSRC